MGEVAPYLLFAVRVFGVFLLWTLSMYLLHRLAHVAHPRNVFWRIHLAHHRLPYLTSITPKLRPALGQFLFWLGNWQESLDVVLVMTLPLLCLSWFFPTEGLVLLIFHYVYEVFFSEARLDHNRDLRGPVTRIFAWGHYHLHHHAYQKRNYGLLITWWDWLFGTAQMPR